MRGAGESLLPGKRWEHRGGEGARTWALIVSLLLHVGLLYLAGGWLAGQQLRTLEAPFVVSLVVPTLPPEEREAPPPRERSAVRVERRTAPTVEQTASEPGDGLPEAPLLEQRPEPPFPPPLSEPAPGESAATADAGIPEPRRDVAGETTDRLLELMDSLSRLPRSMARLSERDAAEEPPAVRPGKAVGIEGPLGKRGLIYLEYPSYSEWGAEVGVEAEVRFRFWVSAAGHVIRIVALRKSAYPEFESLARQALAQWRFEPLPPGGEREEWGEVPIMWRLERPEPSEGRSSR